MAASALAAEEVAIVLRVASEGRPVLVGGQSIAIWADALDPDGTRIAQADDLASKDLDFFRCHAAARLLAAAFNGTVRKPQIGDQTPIDSVVVIVLAGRTLEIDFIGHVLGTQEEDVEGRAIEVDYRPADGGDPIPLRLLHPLDCLWSRLANINTLRRSTPLSLRQAQAAILILERFLFEGLDDAEDAHRQRTDALRELSWGLKKTHVGLPSHLDHGLAPETILLRALKDEGRLDPRWRRTTLEPRVDSLLRRMRQAGERHRAVG